MLASLAAGADDIKIDISGVFTLGAAVIPYDRRGESL